MLLLCPCFRETPKTLSGQVSLCSAWSLQSRDDGMCWPPAGTYQTYSPSKFSFQDFSQLGTHQLSPFHFTWVSIDGASSSWERWTLIREHCSSQLLQSKVKCSLMSQKVTVKVSATDPAQKLMSSHRTLCAKTRGAQDLRFPTSSANTDQETDVHSQMSFHWPSCAVCLTWFWWTQGPYLN